MSEATLAIKRVLTFEHKDSWKFYAAAAVVLGATIYATTSSSKKPKKSKKASKKKSMMDSLKTKNSEKPLLTRVDSKLDEGTLPSKFTPENVESLTDEEKVKLAHECKGYGNDLYKSKQYKEALEAYTQAIALCPDAVYYSNRAACYSMLEDYDKVIDECNKALELNPTYPKVLKRRAATLEKLNKPLQAIEDYMAVSFLEEFRDNAVSASMDAIIKHAAKAETDRLMSKRSYKPPNKVILSTFLDTFPSMSQYINSYRDLPITESMSQSEAKFIQAMGLFGESKYEQAAEFLQAVNVKDISDQNMRSDASVMQGTMYCISGNATEALSVLDEVLETNPGNSSALLRKSAALLERGESQQAMDMVEEAIAANPKDAEAYFQRSQIGSLMLDPSQPVDQMAFITQRALADLEKAVELDPSYLMANIQLGVLKMRLDAKEDSIALFKQLMDKHGKSSANVWNYWGEINMGLDDADAALEAFDKASKISAANPIPLINKSVVMLQLKQNLPMAEEYAKAALETDPTFDLAHVQLGQIYLAQNKFDEAIKCYETAIENARSESDILNYSSCAIATTAQKNVFAAYPALVEKMKEMMTKS